MRLKIATVLTKSALLLGGLVLLSGGFFATQLGIDNNAQWGRGRFLLVGFGSVLIAGSLMLHFARQIRRLSVTAGQRLNRQRAVIGLRNAWASAAHSRLVRTGQAILHSSPLAAHPRWSAALASVLAVLVVLVLFLGYITGGTFTQWTPYQAYFDRLANAFRAGQFALLEEPDPALVALENPYDYRNRGSIPHLWDASLYEGKYYYYWGAVPALILAGVKTLLPTAVDDQYLVFFFCCGLVIAMALLLHHLRERYFPDVPPWTLFPLVLMAGLAMPVFWLINHPNVYETVISGGQFFLITGLYAAFRANDSKNGRGWWLLAGFSWGAAINCRVSLAGAVLFFAVLFAWKILRSRGPLTGKIVRLAWLGAPLLLWFAWMGWYNTARFGNPLETGHRYQLTGMALPGGDYSQVISLSYFIPNTYNYFFRLPEWSSSLLSISLPFVEEKSWPFFIRLPQYYYYSEQVASLLVVVPAVVLAFLPLLGWARRAWWWLHEKQPGAPDTDPAPAWLFLAFTGGAACAIAPLLVFISGSLRYLADATPLITCLAAMGFWWGLRYLRCRPGLRAALLLTGASLMLLSVLFSLVVVFNSNDMRFEAIQPEIYNRIANLLRGQ